MITATNFGTIFKAKKLDGHTKNIVYNRNFISKATEHGRVNEDIASLEFEQAINKIITKCGLYMDSVELWLGTNIGFI